MVKIAVLKETATGETRVAALPETVNKFIALGASVAVEAGAGLSASVSDADYEAMVAASRPRLNATASPARWSGCRRLAAHELFLIAPASAASFDSRYFGPVTRAQVIGRAVPLWTWS